MYLCLRLMLKRLDTLSVELKEPKLVRILEMDQTQNNLDYESNIIGALVGLAIGCELWGDEQHTLNDISLALALANNLINNAGELNITTTWQPRKGSSYLMPDEHITTEAWITPLGLLYIYRNFHKSDFLKVCDERLYLPVGNSVTSTMLAIASGVYLLACQRIMPEDLMSAVLDFLLLPDPVDPLRHKLLMTQDYLEERQTLVDNIEAGDLQDIDLWLVDAKNSRRTWAKSFDLITPADIVASAFYVFTARKNSFKEAMDLAFSVEKGSPDLPPLVGALAGAYHGIEAIPDNWKASLSNYATLVDIAKRLNTVARTRAKS